MKFHLFCLCTILALFGSSSLYSQSRPVIAKEPAWITKNNIDYYKTSMDKDAADGYVDISYECQTSLADQSEYIRRSTRIISKAGVQNGSQVSISYDPSYQQLLLHSIRILRKGETINKLVLANIKTLHQEKELSSFVYNGALDAVLILDDVRPGDVIEYSYTCKGFNPVFKNRYADRYPMQYSVPMYEIYYKLIVPAGRKVNIKNLNETLQPVVTAGNGQQVYEWHKKDVQPLVLQDFTVSWYDPYAQVLVSEYNNWKEVNDWALELFPFTKSLSPAVMKKIREIEATQPNDAERTKTALRFVQDDVRYMGIEMGVNSHKPADPSKVFAQRFGDCKEKSYLLCCMLRAMHIEASPVLINTTVKKNLHNLLPAPTVFDHMTVRVKLDGEYYWFDPTISSQRGDIKKIFYPDYQAGLVITDSTSSLTNIAFRNISYMHIKENFKVASMEGSGSLVVSTTYFGNEADVVRDDFNNSSIGELMNNYQKFYAAYYEDIKADSLTYTDDDSTGIFTTTEYYDLPDFWTVDKDHSSKFSFAAFSINSVLRKPKEKNRKMPFELSYPANYHEELLLDLPSEWKVTYNELHLKNACYAYNSRFYCLSNHVHLDTDYETYKDHSSVEEAPAYFRDLSEYDAVNNFEISSGKDGDVVEKKKDVSSKNIISIIAVLGLFFGGFVWWSQRK